MPRAFSKKYNKDLVLQNLQNRHLEVKIPCGFRRSGRETFFFAFLLEALKAHRKKNEQDFQRKCIHEKYIPVYKSVQSSPALDGQILYLR